MPENKKHILLVEDERPYAEMVALRFRIYGFDCMIAEDTDKAIEAAYSHPYDLVVLDLMLPGSGGLSVLEAIRDRKESSLIPVVVLTGKTITPDIKMKLEGYGVSYMFSKPYDPDPFINAVKHLIGNETTNGG